MANIKEETILELLLKNGMERDTAVRIVREAVQQERDEPKEPSTVKRKEYLVIVNDPDRKLPTDLTGWVVQKNETVFSEDGFSSVSPREWGSLEADALLRALSIFCTNDRKFHRKHGEPTCFGDIMEFAPAAKAKECGFIIKTKQPVAIVGVRPHIVTTAERNAALGVKTTDKV